MFTVSELMGLGLGPYQREALIAGMSAAAGAILLDLKVPDWTLRISTKKLLVQGEGNDVLTQLFGSQNEGLQQLGIAEDRSFIQKFGFDPSPHTRTVLLNRAWKWEVNRRRESEPGQNPLGRTDIMELFEAFRQRALTITPEEYFAGLREYEESFRRRMQG